ncbi:MAG TPA: regulatory signaling modulator protein AmpE [Rheinheimera sp.]|nr:regulatory signaling modulator protein AmpE [Rheinheimera sp.]
MTLISMLLALIIERLAVRSASWQLSTWLKLYLQISRQGPLQNLSQQKYGVVVWWLIPAFVAGVAVYLVDFWLLQLAVNVAVLLLCIGCWRYRQLYKQYLNAAQRGDTEAMALSLELIANQQGAAATTLSSGQRLVWLNFKYYAAVLFWYALLGAFGAVAYATLRFLAEPVSWTDGEGENEVVTPVPEQVSQLAEAFGHWADVLPARLYGLGLALVGDFSRTSQALMQQGADLHLPASTLVGELVYASEPVPEEMRGSVEEAIAMVQLAKRNLLFFLALVAILTLAGWVG